MLTVLEAQCNWVENRGMQLVRDDGVPFYIIAQYFSEIDLTFLGETHRTSWGSLLILEPNIPHSYTCREELLHHWFHLDGDVAGLLERYGLPPNQLYSLQNAEEISAILQQISMTYHDKGLFREDYLELKVRELCINLARQLNLQSRINNLDYSVIMRLRELRFRILEHPEYDWTVAEMASQIYLSESYFYPLYRKCFGITPNRDLIAIRIERARTNLMCGCSVSAAAEKSGYTNIYHFIRQFKKVTGMTPKQYKLQNRISHTFRPRDASTPVR